MSDRLLILWVVVLIELVSPIPGALTIGAIYVLIARPRWFLAWIDELYGRKG